MSLIYSNGISLSFSLPRNLGKSEKKRRREGEKEKISKTLKVVQHDSDAKNGGADGIRTRDPRRDRPVF